MTERAKRPLDALNFFLADVRDGLGPYLSVYLLTVQNWNPAAIGIAMAAGGIAGIAAQTPAGALVDRTRAKRAIIIVAAVIVTLASVALPLAPGFWPVTIAQSLSGAAAAVFPPVVTAITLGIVGPAMFARRIGRNEAFNHAGNAVAAGLAGAAAYVFGPVAVFWLMAAMAVGSIVATLTVPADAIDHRMARGLDAAAEQAGEMPSGWRVLLTSRPLLVFAAATTLFHFANAAMLPLVGQKLALANANAGTTLMSLCIAAAQIVMVPVAALVGTRANQWGRKPIFAVAFAVLVVRGLLYPLSNSAYWLVGVQLLDGIGAGIFGALFPIVVADLTEGTGHFNVSQGAIATAQGLGAALSSALAGAIVSAAGYGPAFLFLAGVAAAGFVLFCLTMPETRRGSSAASSRGASSSRAAESARAARH